MPQAGSASNGVLFRRPHERGPPRPSTTVVRKQHIVVPSRIVRPRPAHPRCWASGFPDPCETGRKCLGVAKPIADTWGFRAAGQALTTAREDQLAGGKGILTVVSCPRVPPPALGIAENVECVLVGDQKVKSRNSCVKCSFPRRLVCTWRALEPRSTRRPSRWIRRRCSHVAAPFFFDGPVEIRGVARSAPR